MAIFLNNKSNGNTINDLKFILVEPSSKKDLCKHIRTIFLRCINSGFRVLTERPPPKKK